jgi:hypothetical protein
MTRRERLQRTIAGLPVDRPAFNFYEINGLDQDPSDASPFNIYNDPSWKPVIDLARDKTDRMPLRSLPLEPAADCPLESLTERVEAMENGSKLVTTRIRCKHRVLTSRTRRDPGLDTTWTVEHLLKDADDLQAYLELPLPKYQPLDLTSITSAEEALSETGLVLVNLDDPLCRSAELFNMADYLLVAFCQPELFTRLLERFAEILYPHVETAARLLPGRSWRVVGAEYAGAPYLPPRLFKQYVTAFSGPIVSVIQRSGGFARIHCHGRLRGILEHIAATGCTGLDPIEPPPQGDVSLAEVRAQYGAQMVLYGNLEANDIELLDSAAFEEKVKRALDEGTRGEGRGFVLMPSASPYGRHVDDRAMRNYECIVRVVETL